MYSFNELYTGFTILILILQTSQQLYEIDQNAQQISLNSIWYPVDSYIGTLFKYCPLSVISHIGPVQRSQTNSYLLYLGYERLTEMLLFLHYVKFLPEERKIIHIVKFNIKNEIMEEEFEFDSNDYEGKWYMQENYIGFYVKRMVNGKSLISQSFFDKEFKLIIGGSLNSVKNSFQEEYLLSSFPGKMKLIFLEQNEKREFYISNLKDCEFNFQALINEYYDYKTQLLQLQVDQEYDTQYLIQVWVQIDDVLSEFQTIQVIRLNLKYQLDEENHIDLTSFQITYISENSKWYYCLQFYSYIYPFIFQKLKFRILQRTINMKLVANFLPHGIQYKLATKINKSITE